MNDLIVELGGEIMKTKLVIIGILLCDFISRNMLLQTVHMVKWMFTIMISFYLEKKLQNRL